MEIDHIFICTSKNAPEGEVLVDFGIKEGSSNTHPGQGTVNRRFFFHNFMLELLWVSDAKEAQNARTMPMRLFDRCSERNRVSPFGLALRPTKGQTETVPFPSWDYKPIYLPEDWSIKVAPMEDLNEPMYFYLPFAQRPNPQERSQAEPLDHRIALEKVTGINVYLNSPGELSQAGEVVHRESDAILIKGSEHLLELEFDHGQKGEGEDFRPILPLVIKW